MSSDTNTTFRSLRLQIAKELVKAGYPKSSAEFKRLSIKKLRELSPEYREREKLKWREYYRRKGKEWNAARIANWRASNPSRWQALMKRAYEKGLYERFYYRNQERIKAEKRAQQARVRRGHPLFGFRSAVAEFKRGECSFEDLFARCSGAFAYLDEQDTRSRDESPERQRSLQPCAAIGEHRQSEHRDQEMRALK